MRAIAFHHECPCPSGCEDGFYDVSGLIDPPDGTVGYGGGVDFDRIAARYGEHGDGCPVGMPVTEMGDEDEIAEAVWYAWIER